MAGFLVIEERTPLPRWLASRIGTYLPVRCRDIAVCGAEGQVLTYHDITSAHGQKKATLRLAEAEEEGIVCGVIAEDTIRRAIESKLKYPLCDGRLLAASLRLERILEETDCARTHIALGGGDSVLGRAVAVWLAKRVRFFSLVGRNKTALQRLARCLWQTEGIAVTVGTQSADRIITLAELTEEADCLAEGQCISSVLAECIAFAGRPLHERHRLVTARTLAETAETARVLGISIQPKNSAAAGRFRLTNAPSVNII